MRLQVDHWPKVPHWASGSSSLITLPSARTPVWHPTREGPHSLSNKTVLTLDTEIGAVTITIVAKKPCTAVQQCTNLQLVLPQRKIVWQKRQFILSVSEGRKLLLIWDRSPGTNPAGVCWDESHQSNRSRRPIWRGHSHLELACIRSKEQIISSNTTPNYCSSRKREPIAKASKEILRIVPILAFLKKIKIKIKK